MGQNQGRQEETHHVHSDAFIQVNVLDVIVCNAVVIVTPEQNSARNGNKFYKKKLID